MDADGKLGTKKGNDGNPSSSHGRSLGGKAAVALCSAEGMDGCVVGYASGAVEVFFGDAARFSATVVEAQTGMKEVIWLAAHPAAAAGGELIVTSVTADGSLFVARVGFGTDRLSSLRTHRITTVIPAAAGSRAFAFAFEPTSRLFATVARDGSVVQSLMDLSLSAVAVSSADPLRLAGLASLTTPSASAATDGERVRAVAKKKAAPGAVEAVGLLREVAAAYLPSGLLAVLGLDATTGQPRLLIINALYGSVLDALELEMEVAPARGTPVALLPLRASGTIALACGDACIAEMPIAEPSPSMAAAMEAASSAVHRAWSAPPASEARVTTAAVASALSDLERGSLTDATVDKVVAEAQGNTLSFSEIDQLVRAAGAKAVGAAGGSKAASKPLSKKQQQQQQRPATTTSTSSSPARRLLTSLLAARKASLGSCEGIFEAACAASDLEVLEALVLGLPDVTESMLVATLQVILAAEGLTGAERDSLVLVVMSRRKNEVLMLQALRSLSRPQVLALLNFSRRMAELYAANPSRPNIVEGKGSLSKESRPQASLRQILDWTTHILDSRFAELVLMPECHQTIISLAAAIEDNKRISEQMQVVQGHVNNIANGKAFSSKAKAKIPDYVVEFLEV